MTKPKQVMELTDEDITLALVERWGKGFEVTVRQILRKKSFQAIVVFYKVKAERDGAIEYRVKTLSRNTGTENVSRIKF